MDPKDPITLLQASAAQMHELFIAFVDAGFTREEALMLLIASLQGARE